MYPTSYMYILRNLQGYIDGTQSSISDLNFPNEFRYSGTMLHILFPKYLKESTNCLLGFVNFNGH